MENAHRRCPVLITLRVADHVYNLRSRRCATVIEEALAAWQQRSGFRIVHYSIQGNHVHMLVEATGRDALSAAVKGIKVRIARGLNRVMDRTGTVFPDRFHDRVLETPRQVRNALAYVLNNARRHKLVDGRVRRDWVDPYSSAPVFDGWKGTIHCSRAGPVIAAEARTWLLSVGWKRAGGAIATDYVPADGR